ncbi:MAG: hypothetical protein R6X02_27910 [Enhygromyxa sp.]
MLDESCAAAPCYGLGVPDWAQELAAITTVLAAAVWLLVRWLQIGKPRGGDIGCARCDHNPMSSAPAPERGVRSKQLRVLDRP